MQAEMPSLYGNLLGKVAPELPKICRFGKYTIFFWSKENDEPIHVHVCEGTDTTMKIIVIKDRPKELLEQLANVWEKSVRASHLFLTEAEINEIKQFIPQALQAVPTLVIAVNDVEIPVGFMGTSTGELEMLFIVPEEWGKGLGRMMARYCIKELSVKEVIVNEENPKAYGFYEKMGFVSYKRSECDEQGRPHPILYMKLNLQHSAL